MVSKEVLDVNWWRGVGSVGSDEMVERNKRRDTSGFTVGFVLKTYGFYVCYMNKSGYKLRTGFSKQRYLSPMSMEAYP